MRKTITILENPPVLEIFLWSRQSQREEYWQKGNRKSLIKNSDDESDKLKKLVELRKKIRKEKHVTLELKFQKWIQEEEEKILNRSWSKKHHRDLMLELIYDDGEPQENLIEMIHWTLEEGW